MQHPTECCSAAVLQAPGQPQQGPQCVVARLLQELTHQHVAILPGLGLHLQQIRNLRHTTCFKHCLIVC